MHYTYVARTDDDEVYVWVRGPDRNIFAVDFRRLHGGETHHRDNPRGDALKLREFLQKLSEKRA